MVALEIGFSVGTQNLNMVLDLDSTRPNENTILRYLGARSLYEPDISNLMLRLVAKGDVVVDVGANIGFFTILAATLTGPTGRVLSFEPGDDNLRRLRNNIGINKFDHVTVIDKPASDARNVVPFFINSDDSGGNAMWDVATFPGNVKSAAAPQSFSLQATTVEYELDQLNLPAPKLIKIDTEGAELQVLKGYQTYLTNRRTPFVIAELHSFGLKKMGTTPKELRAFMSGFGYESFGLYFDGGMPRLIPRTTNIEAPHIINLLFTTPEYLGQFWPSVVHDPGGNQPATKTPRT